MRRQPDPSRLPSWAACLLIAAALTSCDRPAPQEAAARQQAPSPAASPALASSQQAHAPAANLPAVNPPHDPSAGPRMSFISTVHDFGDVTEVRKYSTSFQFTNTGGQPLIIQQVKTTCGCTSAGLKKMQYMPGESGTLDITFEPSGSGNSPKFVNIISNSQPESNIKLTLNANVTPFLVIEPDMMHLGLLQYRREHRLAVTVRCPTDGDFQIQDVETTNPDVIATLLPQSPGQAAREIAVVISPQAKWGGLFSWLKVTAKARLAASEEPITHTSQVRIQAQVFGQLQAKLDTFRFGAKPGERFQRIVTLTRTTGEPFELLNAAIVHCDLPDAAIGIRRPSPNVYELVLSATGDVPRPLVSGTVAITTNVPGEESLEIPIVGVIRSE